MKVLFAHLFICGMCSFLFGQERIDSLRTYPLREYLILGDRMTGQSSELPSPVELITSRHIDQMCGKNLAEILRFVPGVLIRSYGGDGALQSISIRGMSPEYTSVFVDGRRISNAQNGLIDAGLIPLEGIETIEIGRGGYSATVGPDAVGGILNITTKGASPGTHARFHSGLGSFGYQDLGLIVSHGKETIGFRASAIQERGSGDFSYRYDDGVQKKTLQRNGSDFINRQVSAMGYGRLSDNFDVALYAGAGEANRGSATAVTHPDVTSLARLLDRNWYSQLVIRTSAGNEGVLRLTAYLQRQQQRYYDPQLMVSGSMVDSHHDLLVKSLSPELRYPIGSSDVIVGGEVSHTQLRSSETKDASRLQTSIYASTEFRDFFLSLPVIVYPALRYDHFSDAGNGLSPRLGTTLNVLDQPLVNFRFSIGRSYRMPTLNDLYWKSGGNAALMPERSTNIDGGVVADADLYGMIHGEATLYWIDVKNKIVWQPSTGMLWTANQIGRMHSRGVEFLADWRLFEDIVTLRYFYNYGISQKRETGIANDPTIGKQLIYVPKEQLTGEIGLKIAPFSLNITHSYMSSRYITEANDPHYVLPAFHRTDANVQFKSSFWHATVLTKFEVLNVLNSQYSMIALYPMPLRSVNFSLAAEI